MYYFVYHINTIALYWKGKPTSLTNENKWIDNTRITIVECVGADSDSTEIIAEVETAIRPLDAEQADTVRRTVNNVLQKAVPLKPSITTEMRNAPKSLKQDNSIMILPADKGYHSKMSTLIGPYKLLNNDPTDRLSRKATEKLLQLKRRGVFVVFVVIVVFGLRLCVVFGLLALWIFGSLAICHDDHYHYHITLCANKKYERSKTALMKAAFPEMSRVTFVFSFNLINQMLQIADH